MWSETTKIFEGAQGASDTGESTPRKAGPEEFKTDSLTRQLESSFPLKPTKTKEEKPKELPKVSLSPSLHSKGLLLQ